MGAREDGLHAGRCESKTSVNATKKGERANEENMGRQRRKEA